MTITTTADMETYSEIVQVEEFDTEQETRVNLALSRKRPCCNGNLDCSIPTLGL